MWTMRETLGQALLVAALGLCGGSATAIILSLRRLQQGRPVLWRCSVFLLLGAVVLLLLAV